MCGTFAAEENVFVGDIAAGIGFVEDFGACTVPVDFSIGFLDAVAVTVVGVVPLLLWATIERTY
jgi:hypothetical protein